MLTLISRTPLRRGAGWVLALSFAVVACSDRPEATSPSRPMAQASQMNVCDVEGLWAAAAAGGARSTGEVNFEIFNQAPPAPEDDDGSESFALATQLALGLGNAGEGDKYHFRLQTALVTNGATASGHGFLFVPSPDALGNAIARFVVAGKGTHPLAGSFKLSGSGDLGCVSGEGTLAGANNVHVEYEDGTTEETDVFTVHCPPGEQCEVPPPPICEECVPTT